MRWSLLVVLAMFGCESAVLRLEIRPSGGTLGGARHVRTGSSQRPKSAMVLTPHRQIEREMERRLLEANVRVVVPAFTGRVVREGKNETATQLTELERVLIMAQNSGAEVVVEVDHFALGGSFARRFCSDGITALEACTASAAANARVARTYTSRAVELRARIIDTENGQVISVVDVRAPVVNWLELNFKNVQADNARRTTDCDSSLSHMKAECKLAASRATDAVLEALRQAVLDAPIQRAGDAADDRSAR